MAASTRLDVFEYIKSYIQEYGIPPTYREIAQGVGLKSTSAVRHQLDALQSEGRIKLYDGRARAIVVL